MQPLARQDSRPSIYSWWSDSNPGLQGPTINLHAAAKPLSRFLYHRQALNIIKKNRGNPLSTATLEIYSSYFPWDFVSWSTKAAILSELAYRALSSEMAARAVVGSPVLPHIEPILWAPSPQARGASCKLLRSLGSHKSTAPVILELRPCERLVSLLRDEDSQVTREAASVLCEIVQWVDGAQAVVNAKVTDHITILLRSWSPIVRQKACQLVGGLATHESTAQAILELNPCVQLVALLRDEDFKVIQVAMFAICRIARWLDGAHAIVDAKAPSEILTLLESRNPDAYIRRGAYLVLERLANHQSSGPALLEPKTRERLVSLLLEKGSERVADYLG